MFHAVLTKQYNDLVRSSEYIQYVNLSSSVLNKKTHARIQGGGGAGDACPPLFVPNSLKSPLNWQKNLRGEPLNPLRPLLIKILDPPLNPGIVNLAYIFHYH